MAEFKKGDRIVVIRYNALTNGLDGDGKQYFNKGDTGTILATSPYSLYVAFDVARVDDGEWYVPISDVELEEASSVITSTQAAAMLRDDITLHPSDKLEVATALAKLFSQANPEFDAHAFFHTADL